MRKSFCAEGVLNLLRAKARPLELDPHDLTGQICGRCQDTVHRHQCVFDATAGVLGRNSSNRIDVMPVPFLNFTAGCPGELFDAVQCDDVRVVVQAQQCRTAVLDHMRSRDTTPLVQ